jgi:FixJ family two-component response regulator
MMDAVYIIDDDAAVRDALSLMLAQDGLMVESFECAEDFLAFLPQHGRGCAVVDICMPMMDGMTLQEELLAREVTLPIIFLTGHGEIPMSVRAIKAGAVDFLTKPVTRERLLSSVRTALMLSEKAYDQAMKIEMTRNRLNELTEREREVMSLAILGQSNKEIARHLGISHRTVEIHKAKIMHKTGAMNLLELARLAQEGSAAV